MSSISARTITPSALWIQGRYKLSGNPVLGANSSATFFPSAFTLDTSVIPTNNAIVGTASSADKVVWRTDLPGLQLPTGFTGKWSINTQLAYSANLAIFMQLQIGTAPATSSSPAIANGTDVNKTTLVNDKRVACAPLNNLTFESSCTAPSLVYAPGSVINPWIYVNNTSANSVQMNAFVIQITLDSLVSSS